MKMPADCMFNIQNMTTPAFFFLYANRLINSFFKKEHFVSTLFVGCSVTDIQRFIRINMMFIVKFNNMKAAAVDVKVDIPFFQNTVFQFARFSPPDAVFQWRIRRHSRFHCCESLAQQTEVTGNLCFLLF